MKRGALLAVIGLASCSAPTGDLAKPAGDWASMSVASRQQLMKAITTKCGLPDDRLQLIGTEDLQVRPDPNDQYQRIDCLLGELREVPGVRMGFVGNEAYIGNEQ